MSDDFEYDNSNGENAKSGSELRKQLEQALQKAREAETRAAKAEASMAQRNLSDSLGDRGYDKTVAKKITKFIAKDEVDLSDEAAVNSWLEENADIFPAPAPAQDEQTPDESSAPDYSERPEVQAANRLAQVQGNAQPANRTKFETAAAQLGEDATKEEVRKAFIEAGI